MSCKCIQNIEKLLNEKMVAKYPGCEVVDQVAFINETLTIDDEDHTVLLLGNPAIGRVRVGKAIRKFDPVIYPTYCPFCGKKIEGGGEHED